MTTRKKIQLCIPNTGTIMTQTVATMINMVREAGEVDIIFDFVSNCLVHEARDSQVKSALKNGADYLMFLDSDMSPHPETLKSLLSHDKDVVSAMCFKRTPPFQPCFYTIAKLEKDPEDDKKMIPRMESALSPEHWETEGVLEVEAVGMACVLIKMNVFNKISSDNWFFPLPRVGEDITFCLKARSAGIKIYVDLGMNCHHLGVVPFGKEHYTMALQEWYSDPNNKGKNIFNEFA
jgi:hypothetical protein